MTPAIALLLVLLAAQATTPAAPQTNNGPSAQADQPPPSATRPSEQYLPKSCSLGVDGNYDGRDLGMTMPQLVHQVEPKFPKSAKRQKLVTVSVVNLIVDASGRPENVHIAHSAAEKLDPSLHSVGLALDTTAISAVKQYRFKPATCEAKPVPTQLNVEVTFQIY